MMPPPGGIDPRADTELAPPDLSAAAVDAARFLTQATFGPTNAEVSRVIDVGYSAWIDEQIAKPQASHRAAWEAADAAARAVDPTDIARERDVFDSFYRQAVGGDDQLRQRVAFALSEIFVVSLVDGSVADNTPRRGRLPGHACARRVRQLPRPAAGRLAASDDGAVSLASAQPERERRNGPRARRELRARGDAVVLDRPVPAQCRRQRADCRRQADRNLHQRRHLRPRQGVHRVELVRPRIPATRASSKAATHATRTANGGR